MSDGDRILLIVVCTWLLVLLTLALAAYLYSWWQSNQRAQETSTQEVEDAFEVEDDFEEPALKIDPDNPPSWKVYNPPPGKQAPFCTCHGRPLARGENVLMWPDPEEGGYRLFHEGFIKGMVPPRG